MKIHERLLFALAVLGGCIPRQPSRTERPEVPVAPWEERTARSESGHVYRYLYLEGPSGDAPALLLLPGGFFDNRIWLNASGLAEGFRVLALDWPDNSLLYGGRLEDYAAVVEDFLGAVGEREIHLGALSAGVYAALESAARQRGFEVRSLVLISAVMLGVSDEEVKRREKLVDVALGLSPARLGGLVEYGVARSDLEPADGPIQQDEIFWVRPYTYYYQLFRAIGSQGARRQATGGISCPVLVLQGTADETMPAELARRTADLFSDATYRELEGYDHAMVFGHGPEISSIMMEFYRDRGLLPERPSETGADASGGGGSQP